MKSHAYRGRVFHKRFAPAEHDFHYVMDYLFLHVDEIKALCKLSKFWSADAVNLISINRRDYLPGDRPLKEQVELEVARLGGQSGFSDVYLLTTPRRLGHCMNPISFSSVTKARNCATCSPKFTTPRGMRDILTWLTGPTSVSPRQRHFTSHRLCRWIPPTIGQLVIPEMNYTSRSM